MLLLNIYLMVCIWMSLKIVVIINRLTSYFCGVLFNVKLICDNDCCSLICDNDVYVGWKKS